MLATIVASLSATMFAGTPINQSELPKAAQTFITKYFSKDQVRKVEKDNGRRGMEYEVDFTSGAEVDFIFDGNFDILIIDFLRFFCNFAVPFIKSG